MLRQVRVPKRTIEYELIQTARKNLEIRVFPDVVKLFAPQRTRLAVADAFVIERAEWIVDAQKRLVESIKAQQASRPIESGALILVEGIPRTLVVERADKKAIHIEEDRFIVRWPSVDPDAVRAAIREHLIECARDKIIQRLDHHIPLIGRGPGRVTIREQKTRWGSCSSKNNLNFNWKLIMAPPDALDYVVVHELCHLYEFNHSPRFWALVTKFKPDYKAWVQWLKQNGKCLGI